MTNRYLVLDHGRGAIDLLLLSLFGAVQLTLILVHLWFGVSQMQNPAGAWPDLFNIARDFSLGEITNYGLWIIALVSLLAGWSRKKDPLILATAFVFLLALTDDMFQLHESSSHLVMGLNLHLDHGEMAFMFGELAIWATLGVLCLAGLVMSWSRSLPETRSALLPQAVLFGALIFFAIGVDFIHGLAEDRTFFAGILGVIEDGGEMLVLTLIAAHAWPTFGRAAAVAHPA